MAKLQVLLLKSFILVVAVEIVHSLDNPKIQICNNYNLTHATSDCFKGSPTINSKIGFDNPEKNVLSLTKDSKYVHLKCTASYPIRWLAHKPLGCIIISNVGFRNEPTTEYVQHIRVEPMGYVRQGPVEEDCSDFSRILRCEHFNSTTLAAEIYLNYHDSNDSSKSISFETDGSNFFLAEKTPAGKYIIPCAAKSFGSQYDMTLTKRVNDAEIFSAKCAICACYGSSPCFNDTFPCFEDDICGSGNMSFWDNKNANNQETSVIDDEKECLGNFGCSTCKIQDHMKKYRRNGVDCNKDGILTCVDYARAYIFGNSGCEDDSLLEGDDKFQRFEKCYNEAEENFTILENQEYKPQMGFRLNGDIDLETIYECSSLLRNAFYVSPLNESQRIRASLTINNSNTGDPSISCIPEEDVNVLDLHISDCLNISHCDLKFKSVHPYLDFEKPSSDTETIVITNNDNATTGGTGQPRRNYGFVQCSAVFHLFSQPKLFGYVHELDYMFRGVDDKIYFHKDRITNASILVDSDKQTVPVEHNWYLVNCKISTFVLLPYISFEVKYKDFDDWKTIWPTGDAEVREFRELDDTEGEERFRKKWVLEVKLTKSMEKIACSAPYIDTPKRVRSEKQIQVDAAPSNIYLYVFIPSAFVLFLIMAISIWVFRGKASQINRKLTKYEVDEFFFGSNNSAGDVDEIFIGTLGFSKEKAITPNRLQVKFDEKLGSGQFGMVCKGTLDEQSVAVKTTKPEADVEYFKAFLREIKVINYIGEHENIVQFYGAVVERIQDCICYAVFELSPIGSLYDYLSKYGKNFVEEKSEKRGTKSIPQVIIDGKSKVELNMSVLISFSEQISNGMAYLAGKKVIHGDLATRNVLVFQNNVVKVTDFGLSRKLYECSEYVKTKQAPLPWRWMALESLRYLQFSSQSDVWSLGVTIWEIFSFGRVPYSGLTWSPDFGYDIENGLRLSKPPIANAELYQWMLKCWDNEPENRPTFSACVEFFKDFDSKDNKKDRVNVNTSVKC